MPLMNTKHIDGATHLYGIIGDPISAVRSPQFFNPLFNRLGINAVFVPFQVEAAGLADAWAGIKAIHNMAGLVITMPHKTLAAGLVDALGPTAKFVGAVNAAWRGPDGRWLGEMFDGEGFVDGLLNQGHAVKGRCVQLVGTGGAGAAIAFALARVGVACLALDDFDTHKRDQLVRRLKELYPAVDVVCASGALPGNTFDMVINATPMGMNASDPLPFEPAEFARHTLVVDIITKPELTPLLMRAQSLGQAIHSGRHMHEGQATRVARFFGFPAADGVGRA